MTDQSKLTTIHLDLTAHSAQAQTIIANVLANDICASDNALARRANLLAFLETSAASGQDFPVLCGLAPMPTEEKQGQKEEPKVETPSEPEAPVEAPAKPSGFGRKS